MTLTDRNFQRLVRAAMALGALLLLIAGLAVMASVDRSRRYTTWVNHSHAVQKAVADYTIFSERIEVVRRGYVLLHDDRMFARINVTLAKMPALLDRLTVMTRDNRLQQARIAALRPLAATHEASVRHTFTLMAVDDAATQAIAGFGIDASIANMDAIRKILTAMDADEAQLLVARDAEQAAGLRGLYITLVVSGALIVLVMGGMLWLILRYTADLNRSQDALRTLNLGLEDAVAARTAELSRANGEIQRFAYIVSHDLRSPLVNIMGFTAELEGAIAPLTALIDRVDADAPALMTTDARAAKADLPEAVHFIRTSTDKMDRLINSILRLSREGRRTLAPASIDLAALATTVRAGFAHRLGEVGAEVDVAGPFPPLVSDRLALEQILSNLIENAIKYLAPGRPGRIVVSARAEGHRVIIDVADNGRGVAPADHERIFELFRRAGPQDQPGEGLGLAHVRALSYRLGGIITCISSLGDGATFRLSLPRVLEADREGAAR